jgi:hypothetical protein
MKRPLGTLSDALQQGLSARWAFGELPFKAR